MLEVGRVCVKIAGRSAGKKVVIVDRVDENFVVVDGPVKRKRCNVKHLEPLAQVVEVKKGASHGEVVKALEKAGVPVVESKPRVKGPRPRGAQRGRERVAEPVVEKKAKEAEKPNKKKRELTKGAALEKKQQKK